MGIAVAGASMGRKRSQADTKAARIEKILMAHPDGLLAHQLVAAYLTIHGELLAVKWLSMVASHSLYVLADRERADNPKEYRYAFNWELWKRHNCKVKVVPAPPYQTCPTCRSIHNGWIRPKYCRCGAELPGVDGQPPPVR